MNDTVCGEVRYRERLSSTANESIGNVMVVTDW